MPPHPPLCPLTHRDVPSDRRLLEQGEAVVLFGVDLLLRPIALAVEPGLAALGDLEDELLDVLGVGDHAPEGQPTVGAAHVDAVQRDHMKMKVEA